MKDLKIVFKEFFDKRNWKINHNFSKKRRIYIAVVELIGSIITVVSFGTIVSYVNIFLSMKFNLNNEESI